jgi:Xaa-Pro aminopeptidase
MNAYALRRKRLLALMEPGSVAVLATAPEVPRNSDSDYPYRHDSHFYYLTGFTEPEAVLVLVAPHHDAPAQAILFCREKNAEREIWEGYRHGPEAAREAFGFDAAFPVAALDVEMARLLANVPTLYAPHGRAAQHAQLEPQIKRWIDAVRAQSRTGVTAPETQHNLLPLIDEMRLIKDEYEQATMLRAATISGQAHARAMRASRPGMHEYEIEAELLYEFRRQGATGPAYPSIVASGPNACVLHYVANNRQLQDGELVLIDAGCEFDGYASDVTRTYPANGRFSGPQRTLYELVLAAQAAALAAVRPGQPYSGIHDAALRVLVQGMLDTGLITSCTAVDDAIAERAYLPFYMHGTGHWIGADVHDVGQYRAVQTAGKPSRPLVPGMALTVEPGLYVRPAAGVPEQFWHIGIRIEDDVLVTDSGGAVLSDGAPKTVADIEHLMRQA